LARHPRKWQPGNAARGKKRSKRRIVSMSDEKGDAPIFSKEPALDPVNILMLGLKNQAVATTKEVKLPTGGVMKHVTSEIPADAILKARALLTSFFPANKVYPFRLTANGAISTDTGGSALGFIDWTSTSQYPEWSAISSLFDEVKGVKNNLTLCSTFSGSSTAIVTPFAIAPKYNDTGSNPASFAVVWRLARSRIIVGGLITTGRPPHMSAGRPVMWASVTDVYTNSPPSGLVGQWDFANQAAGTHSIGYFNWQMEFHVNFRLRA